jgi:hypothetical protein
MRDRNSLLPGRKLWAIAALATVAIATTPSFGDSIKNHPQQSKERVAIGIMESGAAENSGFSPDAILKGSGTWKVKYGVTTFLTAWVLYNPDTCKDLSPGNWVGKAAPKYGVATEGYLTGHLANNVCPTHTYKFRSLYYKWDKKTSSKTDQFKATWVGNSKNELIGTFNFKLE